MTRAILPLMNTIKVRLQVSILSALVLFAPVPIFLTACSSQAGDLTSGTSQDISSPPKANNSLVVAMTNPRVPFEQRCEAEDALLKEAPVPTLLLLLPHIEPFPPGGIWPGSPIGREHDHQSGMTPDWEITYAVGRVWTAQLYKLDGDRRQNVLNFMLTQCNTAFQQEQLVRELNTMIGYQRHFVIPCPATEQVCLKMLKDTRLEPSARRVAAKYLCYMKNERYQEMLMAKCVEQTDLRECFDWFRIFGETQQRFPQLMVPVVSLGSKLLEAELKKGDQFSASFVAHFIGNYVDKDFTPRRKDGLEENLKAEESWARTVKNAHVWLAQWHAEHPNAEVEVHF